MGYFKRYVRRFHQRRIVPVENADLMTRQEAPLVGLNRLHRLITDQRHYLPISNLLKPMFNF